MEINEGKYQKLFNDSVTVLDRLMADKSDDELNNKDLTRIKAATTVVSSYPRYRQAQAQTASVIMSVLEGASEDKAQYRQLIREHLPRVGVLRAIPELLTSRILTDKPAEDRAKALASQLNDERQNWNKERGDLLFRLEQAEKNK